MPIKLAPYAFIISIMLVLSTLIPSRAFAESELSLLWEKEFNGHFYNEVATTSSNDTLMNTYKISKNANFEEVYTYDFMKLDATGNIIDTKQLKDGITKIFEYNGQGYVAFLNQTTNKIELYNENFNLVFSDVITGESRYYSIFVKGNVLALTDFDSKTAVYYSLDTFKKLPSSQISVEKYILENDYDEYTDEITYSIQGLTFAQVMSEEVPLNSSQLNGLSLSGGYIDETVKYKGYFYIPINAYDSEEYYSMLYKVDMQGNIIDKHNVGSYSNGSVAINNKIIIASDQYYVFDLDSFKLIDQYETKGAETNIGKVNSNLFYYQSGDELVVSDSKGDKFRIPGIVYPRETYGKYFVGSTYQTDSIFNTENGELLLSEENYQLGAHNDTVIAFKVVKNSSESKTSVVKRYGTKTDMPQSDLFAANKKWTVKFNTEVDPTSVNDNSIYVLDSSGNKVKDITTTTMGSKVEVHASKEGYTSGKTYTLHVTNAVKSTKNTILKKEETKTFTIE